MGRNRGRDGNRSGRGVGGMVEFNGHYIIGSFFLQDTHEETVKQGILLVQRWWSHLYLERIKAEWWRLDSGSHVFSADE